MGSMNMKSCRYSKLYRFIGQTCLDVKKCLHNIPMEYSLLNLIYFFGGNLCYIIIKYLFIHKHAGPKGTQVFRKVITVKFM